MDTHDIHQKDFLSSLFPPDQQQSSDATLPMFHYNAPSQAQQPMQENMAQNLNPIDMLGTLMRMQGLDSQATSPATTPTFNPQSMLEQQFKLSQLQQLQQLQNQIFQQQIALISGQTPGMMQPSSPNDLRQDSQPQSQYSGLPTPGPSTEIHAQPSLDYVSPMILNGSSFQPQENYQLGAHIPLPPSNYGLPRGSTSAPEQVAFRPMNSHPALPPADLDFDISPLASPWLGAHHQPTQPSSSNKRSASASGDEGNNQPSRKKQSPAIRPTNPNAGRRTLRGSKSTNSTPLLRCTRSRRGSVAGELMGDTPSPVDLSMPPPAPPAPVPQESSSSSSSSSSSIDSRSSPAFNAQLTPVTPASIMNLGRLGINYSGGSTPRPMVPLKGDAKAKTTAGKSTVESASRSKRKTGAVVSPNLKAILPAGTLPTISTFSTSTSTNTSTPTSPIFSPISPSTPMPAPTTALPAPPLQVRKTSHKAAEQKRRDSLKTTFDELRLLLPPLPLPTDPTTAATATDEQQKSRPMQVLPGALPPRGPPKAGGEGPNKGVSKLQLLMCGNEYIRVLKGRVERRDEEVGRLRREVRRLRGRIRCRREMGDGMEVVDEEFGGMLGKEEDGDEEFDVDLDLERDLDAVEALGGAFGMRGVVVGYGPMGGATSVMGDDEADDDEGE